VKVEEIGELNGILARRKVRPLAAEMILVGDRVACLFVTEHRRGRYALALMELSRNMRRTPRISFLTRSACQPQVAVGGICGRRVVAWMEEEGVGVGLIEQRGDTLAVEHLTELRYGGAPTRVTIVEHEHRLFVAAVVVQDVVSWNCDIVTLTRQADRWTWNGPTSVATGVRAVSFAPGLASDAQGNVWAGWHELGGASNKARACVLLLDQKVNPLWARGPLVLGPGCFYDLSLATPPALYPVAEEGCYIAWEVGTRWGAGSRISEVRLQFVNLNGEPELGATGLCLHDVHLPIRGAGAPVVPAHPRLHHGSPREHGAIDLLLCSQSAVAFRVERAPAPSMTPIATVVPPRGFIRWLRVARLGRSRIISWLQAISLTTASQIEYGLMVRLVSAEDWTPVTAPHMLARGLAHDTIATAALDADRNLWLLCLDRKSPARSARKARLFKVRCTP